MKKFPFLSGEGKNRNESQDNDHHGEENRAAHLPGCSQRRFHPFFKSKTPALLAFGEFAMAKDILRHHDAGIHKHPDGNRDAGKRHDIGSDAELFHQQK